ncbi:MAG: hypothetical protein F4201_05760 [Nitrospira sp. SB0677_bin_15]|nr:hypothetical protein [Nitrospira sp. SB0667_bin_9]MYD31599.1 hypothetical protein [Nitrospira sp. SB0661_bin_20]MYG40304.1 hypothetical protein [Nitrospira sp. SB0677_bin_15]MYH01601.1 hypothetical protein [Nitrospira sp. SB0675_bin_23]MYJ23777.1 hypothetical protein [Nitrospira sp. SB0673_bin_12]
MDGIRFERRGEGDYYKVILHIGSTYVPISDEDVETLKKESALSGAFLEFFLDRIGYSSYLKDQLKAELGKIGNSSDQLSLLRQAIQKL